MSVELAHVSIVIPALNEAEGLGDVLRGLQAGLPAAEIVVVDDGSTDDTAKIAADAGVKVHSNDRCRGYGVSLRTGIRLASRSYILKT